jgi:protein-L-isoaspartate(D-aspartate) O-methyltransferase
MIVSMRGDTHSPESLVAQLEAQGIRDERVLRAIREVPREDFVPPSIRAEAWANRALPIGRGQTISQPYVVALMTEAARVGPGDRVLEIGTGSGYQAAVLAALGCKVFSIERQHALANSAAAILAEQAPDVSLRVGDGTRGWPEAAPFDAVLVTAATEHLPEPLREQLAPGGRLVVPEGNPDTVQLLRVYRKADDGEFEVEDVCRVRFVPLIPDED